MNYLGYNGPQVQLVGRLIFFHSRNWYFSPVELVQVVHRQLSVAILAMKEIKFNYGEIVARTKVLFNEAFYN